MPTPYQTIHDRFLQKIQTWSFMDMSDEQIDDHLDGYMTSATANFLTCRKDLELTDNVLRQFEESLSNLEIEIISVLMLIEYLSPKLNTDELMQQSLSSKDYRLYSQANHIQEIRKLRNEYLQEADSLMSKYSYHRRDFNDFV